MGLGRRAAFAVPVVSLVLFGTVGTNVRHDASASPPSPPAPTQLGTLGGDFGSAYRVNDAGQVIGTSATTNDAAIDGYLWSASGGMRDLGVLPTVTETNPEALSPDGGVAGNTLVSGADYHAFWWKDGDLEDVGTLGGAWSNAVAVNDSGQVAGSSATSSPFAGTQHAYIWTKTGGIQDLGTLGGNQSDATGMNASGQVVGWTYTTPGVQVPFSWTASGGMQALTGNGFTSGQGLAVNDAGAAVGDGVLTGGSEHAFLWTAAGGMQDLGVVPGALYSFASQITPGGAVIGTSGASTWLDGFVWTPADGITDVGSLGGTETRPLGANDEGVVVGESRTSNGQIHAFYWTADTGIVDLAPSSSSSDADSVTDQGEIAGTVDNQAVVWQLPSPFVSASGTQLTLDGQPFRPIGLNIYNANSDGNCWYAMRSGTTLGDSLTSIGAGANTIRAWFFQSLATTNGQRDWSGFDHTLAVAKAHHVKVIATLGNQWGDCEPGVGFRNEAWYESGYKQVDPGGTVSYYDWAQEVAARYKDDPTILAWQLLNEPEVQLTAGGSCDDVPESKAAGDLFAWANDVGSAIKSVDPNHLISLGTIGNGQCGTQNGDYETVMSVPSLDLCEFHDYTPSQPLPGDQWNGLQVRIDQCGQLGKPILVGELGVKPNDVGGTLQDRADVVTGKLCAEATAGVAGTLLWAWDKDGSLLGDYDIGPGDPVLGALAPWTDPTHTCSSPGAPANVVAAAGDGTASVSWLRPPNDGGGSVTGYTVTALPGAITQTLDSGTTTASFSGLTDGTPYTFTVTASNGAGTGPGASAGPVTPTSGATTPVTVSGSAPAGGTVSTGGNPTPAAPTATAVTVPAGGDVAIVQSTPTETPPTGFLFLGQQVTITAPDATSDQPLTLEFTLDGSLLDAGAPGDVQIFRTEGGGNTSEVPTCTASDGTATPDPCVASRTLDGSGDAHVVVLTSTASVWNAGLASDTTPPTVTAESIAPALIGPTQSATLKWHANENGTYSVRVGGTSCTSGTQVASGAYANEPARASTLVPGSALTAGSNTVRVCVQDAARNTGSATKSLAEDATPPTITVTTPAVGASYTLGASVKASYRCTDAGGATVASCAGPVSNGALLPTQTVGAKSFVVTATDTAANRATKTVQYLVVYPFSGFQPPVSNPPAFTQFSAGAPVPVKFSLGGNRGLGVLAAVTTAPVNCSTRALTGAAATATGSLAYDKTASRYTYTWQTSKAWVGTCRVLTVTLADTTTHLAYFRFGK